MTDATVPWELLDGEHPDHADWVRSARRCFDPDPHECPLSAVTQSPETFTSIAPKEQP